MLDSHNSKRSSVSPSAASMTRLIWDDRLAAGAQTWAEGCKLAHRIGNYGENLYVSTNPPEPTDAVDGWDEEKKWYDLSSNSCNDGEMCGHYTQVVWATTRQVGCGINMCTNGAIFGTWYYIVCRYWPQGNWMGTKPYIAGPSCSKCKTGACKNNLCG
ncbi:GLIPR1-like protein 1 isoform X2 [Lingula anatina]|uniref:GLIPR1-like protein 1 isoform X2 n=1 Tax=Lingula anatina TaxID=7574 RepID=A0A1S3JBL5_LINAN|nr:GLIPR1-like protein 1 isoform X2 [Lingula anatina]|eukprot:XP_013407800.1 GLIPR1-like protein 1 isoform X2 [Lingula anatina]